MHSSVFALCSCFLLEARALLAFCTVKTCIDSAKSVLISLVLSQRMTQSIIYLGNVPQIYTAVVG
jgi:hypothetical protein